MPETKKELAAFDTHTMKTSPCERRGDPTPTTKMQNTHLLGKSEDNLSMETKGLQQQLKAKERQHQLGMRDPSAVPSAISTRTQRSAHLSWPPGCQPLSIVLATHTAHLVQKTHSPHHSHYTMPLCFLAILQSLPCPSADMSMVVGLPPPAEMSPYI